MARSASPDAVRDALQTATELRRKYEISALDGFIDSCRRFAQAETLNAAILGRFKAGKSSFLNHLFGRQLLPVGAVPVTAVVTGIEYGPRDRAEVVFQNGNREEISPDRIGEFVSEAENSENCKEVAEVRVELVELERYRGIRFVDTPGLESVLAHNTKASRDWLPNVGLALVAVGVDPPLSQRDVELIRTLSHYTPKISILLTKVDIVDERERSDVQRFVEKQLPRHWGQPIPVFPYSVRPGFEHLRTEIDEKLLARARAETGQHHTAILGHKVDSLLSECSEYLTLALKAAETGDSERERLRQTIVGEKQHLDETRQALRLVARHTAATTRTVFEGLLEKDELAVLRRLLAALNHEYPAWTGRLDAVTERFDEWMTSGIVREMANLSNDHREEFVVPIRRVSRLLSQSLQDFRNRLSERTLSALDVPLRTTEMELHVEAPRSPDVRVGKIFDRSWELLSFLLPMGAIRGLLKKHFERKVADVVFANLSRLASQWDELVRQAIDVLEKEAVHRLEDLVGTVETLLAPSGRETVHLRADLVEIEELQARLRGRES